MRAIWSTEAAPTFSEQLVERSASATPWRLWSGSCLLKRPLFRELPPSVQKDWARAGTVNELSDDKGLRERCALVVATIWDVIPKSFLTGRDDDDG